MSKEFWEEIYRYRKIMDDPGPDLTCDEQAILSKMRMTDKYPMLDRGTQQPTKRYARELIAKYINGKNSKKL